MIEKCTAYRANFLATMNTQDSRWNFIIQIELESCNLATFEDHKFSTLTFLDLASSNRISRVGVTGQQMMEGVNIGKSLGGLLGTIEYLNSRGSHSKIYCIKSFILNL